MTIREKLYQKLKNEFSNFKEELKNKDKDYIIDRAYEIAIKDEMVSLFEPSTEIFDIDKSKVLLKLDEPLACLYDDWINNAYSIGSEIEDSTQEYLSILLIEDKAKTYYGR